METSAYEYEEGDILINVYTLEADTLFLLELSEAVKKTDGTTEEYGVQKITYDTEMTDEMKDLYQKMNEEPLRTVSIVLDPDTDQEKPIPLRLPRVFRCICIVRKTMNCTLTVPARKSMKRKAEIRPRV